MGTRDGLGIRETLVNGIFNNFSEWLSTDTVGGLEKLSKGHPCPQVSPQGSLPGVVLRIKRNHMHVRAKRRLSAC